MSLPGHVFFLYIVFMYSYMSFLPKMFSRYILQNVCFIMSFTIQGRSNCDFPLFNSRHHWPLLGTGGRPAQTHLCTSIAAMVSLGGFQVTVKRKDLHSLFAFSAAGQGVQLVTGKHPTACTANVATGMYHQRWTASHIMSSYENDENCNFAPIVKLIKGRICSFPFTWCQSKRKTTLLDANANEDLTWPLIHRSK